MIPRGGGGLEVAGSQKKSSCISVAVSRVCLPNNQSKISLTEENDDEKKDSQESERFVKSFSLI